METKPTSTDFFLGATTGDGFLGYFDQLSPGERLHLYLLKAGPGCGKSTFMRKLAQRTQEPLQYIHCSSDPGSLDGVIFSQREAAILDATPPHTLEPKAPGAAETVVSLYDTMNTDKLRPMEPTIQETLAHYKVLRQHAARYVSSAAGLLMDSRRSAACCTDFDKLRRYVAGLANRLLPKNDAQGREQIRLLSGVTPDGMIFYKDTVPALADKIYVFQDPYGASARLAMELLRTAALTQGWQVITCRCAMHPEEKIDHLILPELRLAFLTSNPWHACKYPGQKNIHYTRFTDMMHLRHSRSRLRFNQKAVDELLAQGIEQMARGRACHNALEACYIPAVDFSMVDQRAEECARMLGLADPE